MTQTKQISTVELFDRIRSSPEQFARSFDSQKLHDNRLILSDYIKDKMAEKSVCVKDLIIKTTLSQSHIYQILGGTRAPGRDVLLSIALAMSLSLEETQRLLLLGQMGALYPKVRRDAAIICCIEQKLDLSKTNEFLLSISEHEIL